MGFSVRPWFPLQHEVDEALKEYAQSIRGALNQPSNLEVKSCVIDPHDALVPAEVRLKTFRKMQAFKSKGPKGTCL